MSIGGFFTTNFTVKRKKWVDDKTTVVQVDTFDGQIQKTDIGLAEQFDTALMKTFTIWANIDINVAEGDTLYDDYYTYSVRAVRRYNIGNNQHTRIIVERKKEYASI